MKDTFLELQLKKKKQELDKYVDLLYKAMGTRRELNEERIQQYQYKIVELEEEIAKMEEEL